MLRFSILIIRACPKPVFLRLIRRFNGRWNGAGSLYYRQKSTLSSRKHGLLWGEYLNCDADDVVCNQSSYGKHHRPPFKPCSGDEVLTTNLEYGVCDRAWKYYYKSRALYITTRDSFPIEDKESVVQQFMAEELSVAHQNYLYKSSPVLQDYRLPVEEICRLARDRGIMTFVDGAHGAGQVEVDITKMDVDIYTGASQVDDVA